MSEAVAEPTLPEAPADAAASSERVAILVALAAGDARRLVEIAVEAARHGSPSQMLPLLGRLTSLAEPRLAREDDERVATASIWRHGTDIVILLQPRFIREHVHTARCLLFVLLHEVMHHVLGHLWRPVSEDESVRVPRALRGIAADMEVNRLLCQHVFGKPPPILRQLYEGKPMPVGLLAPPRVDAVAGMEIADDFPTSFAGRLFWLHREAHEGDASYDALLEQLVGLFPSVTPDLASVLLLGSDQAHHGESQGDAPVPGWLKYLAGELGTTLGRLAKQLGGAGFGQDLVEDDVQKADRQSRELWEAVRRALLPGDRAHLARRAAPEQGVLPSAGRRELYLLAQGTVPVLWPTPVDAPRPVEEQATVYVDVSLSMRRQLPFVLGMLDHVGDVIGRVFQFSNQVMPFDPEGRARGRVLTTGGTDFDCVARHALAGRARSIVIVSDGDAQIAPSLERELLARVRVFSVLTEEDSLRSPLITLSGGLGARDRRWWTVPDSVWEAG